MQTAQQFRMNRLEKTSPVNFLREVDLVNNLVGDLRGKGDEFQDLIEAEHGDGFQDGGFSLGYLSGYDAGYHDAHYICPQSRGLNFYDRLVQRHELLIEASGEPVILLRRKWTGELCPCKSMSSL